MPSPADSALAVGFNALLSASGETLTFRGASVAAVVDRSPESSERPGTVNFKPHDASVIQIKSDAVSPIPRAGEAFEDVDGLNHRIQKVQRISGKIICHCKTS